MDSEQPRWNTFYNKEENKLDLCNYQVNIGNQGITADEIKDIVQSIHIDHKQLKVINLGNFIYT